MAPDRKQKKELWASQTVPALVQRALCKVGTDSSRELAGRSDLKQVEGGVSRDAGPACSFADPRSSPNVPQQEGTALDRGSGSASHQRGSPGKG